MTAKPKNNKQWYFVGAAIAVAAAWAWSFYTAHFPSWTEEVLLSDGRMIEVKRAHKLNTDQLLIETSLTLDLPELGGQKKWREILWPAIVDVSRGEVYVVGHVTRRSAAEYFYPRYGYVAFKFSGGMWRRVPFLSVPPEIRTSENLAGCARHGELKNWSQKTRSWCDFHGSILVGHTRNIDIEVQEKHGTRLAALSGKTPKSD